MASSTADLVLVGLCDGELDTKRHQSTFLTNKVGGRPDVPSPLSRLVPCCGLCGSTLAHVVQIYCPLEGSPYHRTLNVFACPGADCSGRSESWTVLRSQSLEGGTVSVPPPPQDTLAATDWCDSADDWGMEEEKGDDGWGENMTKQSPAEATQNGIKADPASVDMELSCKLEELQLSPPENAPCFRPYFISVMEESDLFEESQELAHAQKLLRDYEKREGIAAGQLDCCEEGGGGEEKYEKTKVKHGDAVFARFMKMISACPEQILRYCRGSKPLFISEPPPKMSQVVSACASCGGPRTFELQLMPALVSLLQAESSELQLEFGTVLVYTCLSSCWTPGADKAVEETCYVQSDPDQQLFK